MRILQGLGYSDPVHLGLGMPQIKHSAFVCRTILLNPNKWQEATYMAVHSAQLALINYLIEGNKLSDAYEVAKQAVEKAQPSLVQYLTKNFGFAIGMWIRTRGVK